MDNTPELANLSSLIKRANRPGYKVTADSAVISIGRELSTDEAEPAFVDVTVSGNADSRTTEVTYTSLPLEFRVLSALIGHSTRLNVKVNIVTRPDDIVIRINNWFLNQLVSDEHPDLEVVNIRCGDHAYVISKDSIVASVVVSDSKHTKITSDCVSIMYISHDFDDELKKGFKLLVIRESDDENVKINNDGPDTTDEVNPPDNDGDNGDNRDKSPPELLLTFEQKVGKNLRNHIISNGGSIEICEKGNEIIYDMSGLPNLAHVVFEIDPYDAACVAQSMEVHCIFHETISSLKSVTIDGSALYIWKVVNTLVESRITKVERLALAMREECYSGCKKMCEALNLLPQLTIGDLQCTFTIKDDRPDPQDDEQFLVCVQQLINTAKQMVGLHSFSLYVDWRYVVPASTMIDFHELLTLPLQKIAWSGNLSFDYEKAMDVLSRNETLTHLDIINSHKMQQLKKKSLFDLIGEITKRNKTRNAQLIVEDDDVFRIIIDQ